MASEHEPQFIDGMPVRSEEIGFRPDQMVVCPQCSKLNPPDRSGCLYCGTLISTDTGRLTHRLVEEWENGYNLIVLPDGEADISAAAAFLSLETAVLTEIVARGSELPVARLESYAVAAAAAEKLSDLGLDCIVVDDETLNAERPPNRLRLIKFIDGGIELTDFNTQARRVLTADEIELIVTGTIFESRTETVEKRKRKQSIVDNESEFSSDGAVIDIYAGADANGFRVAANGFDFSGLGNDRSLLAGENMRRLAERLRSFAPRAVFRDGYAADSQLIEKIWPQSSRKNSIGVKRVGIGRMSVSNVTTRNNLVQFTKYSRLCRHLL